MILGVQVVLGALVFAGGIYGLRYAFESRALHPDTGAFYVFVGTLAIIAGGAICFEALVRLSGGANVAH